MRLRRVPSPARSFLTSSLPQSRLTSPRRLIDHATSSAPSNIRGLLRKPENPSQSAPGPSAGFPHGRNRCDLGRIAGGQRHGGGHISALQHVRLGLSSSYRRQHRLAVRYIGAAPESLEHWWTRHKHFGLRCDLGIVAPVRPTPADRGRTAVPRRRARRSRRLEWLCVEIGNMTYSVWRGVVRDRPMEGT